jgi:predicted RNase H-like nuclease (RuvC/YqgF family)
METLYVWLLTFAGATMVGCFLSSERELGKQRREINWLRRNHRPSEAQGSETHASAELMTRKKELVETISSLSAQLEESKRTVEELQCEQRQLVSAGELNQQLQASHKTIEALEAEKQRLGDVNFENQHYARRLRNSKPSSRIRSPPNAVSDALSLLVARSQPEAPKYTETSVQDKFNLITGENYGPATVYKFDR